MPVLHRLLLYWQGLTHTCTCHGEGGEGGVLQESTVQEGFCGGSALAVPALHRVQGGLVAGLGRETGSLRWPFCQVYFWSRTAFCSTSKLSVLGAVKQAVLTPFCIKHLLRQLKPRKLHRCWGFQHKAGHGLLRCGTSPPDGTWLCQGRADTSVASSMVLVVAIPTSLPQGCSRLVPQFPYLGRGVRDCSAESFELQGLEMLGKSLSLSGRSHQPLMGEQPRQRAGRLSGVKTPGLTL